MEDKATKRPLIAAGTALGIGLGGFLDGIVLHQLLQVHNMLSARYPTRGLRADELVVNLQINIFWDGLFHVLTWLMTALGLVLLWNAVRRPNLSLGTSTLVGSMIFGWGLFNLVEGIVNHHILQIHHVTESANHLTWDIAFLASAVLLIVLGLVMIRKEGEPQSSLAPIE